MRSMLVAGLVWGLTFGPALADSLPSWQEGPTKAAIVAFIDGVADPDSADFVPPEDRIAVFDNDGTLWAEKPFYFQLFFAIDQAKSAAIAKPGAPQDPALAAAAAGDLEALAEQGEAGLLALIAGTHAGTTPDEFEEAVRDWLTEARHPEKDRPFTELVYQPMLELLDYLRDKEFQVYIVSGGGIAFMRAWTEPVYGVPPEQVIGSSMVLEYVDGPDGPSIQRQPEVNFINDKAGKPIGIQRHIGKRPIFAGGNSDGDLQMLSWTTAGAGPRFALLVHHTDAEREWAYDRESHVGRLDKALDKAGQDGWTVIDMKNDWLTVFPPAP